MTEPNQDAPSANAQKAKEIATGWIASADVKASALLAVAGAVLAIALASPVKGGAEAILLGLFSVGTAVSIVASAFVIFPRTDRMDILTKAKCADPLTRSPTFFSDLGLLDFPDFKALVSEADDAIKRRDLFEQAYVMAVIARRKMRLMGVAVVALAIAMIFLCAAFFTASLRAFLSGDQDADRKELRSSAGGGATGDNMNATKGAANTSESASEKLGSGTEGLAPQYADDGGVSDGIDAGIQERMVPSR